MRLSHVRRAPVIAALAALALAFPCAAQQSVGERGAFVVRRHGQPAATERWERLAGRLHSVIDVPGEATVDWSATTGDDGSFSRFDVNSAFHGPHTEGKHEIVQATVVGGRTVVRRWNDALVPMAWNDTFATGPNPVLAIPQSTLTVELLLMRARARGGSSATIPFLQPTGPADAEIRWVGDSASVRMPDGTRMVLAVDARGHVLGGRITGRDGGTIERAAQATRSPASTAAAPAGPPAEPDRERSRTPGETGSFVHRPRRGDAYTESYARWGDRIEAETHSPLVRMVEIAELAGDGTLRRFRSWSYQPGATRFDGWSEVSRAAAGQARARRWRPATGTRDTARALAPAALPIRLGSGALLDQVLRHARRAGGAAVEVPVVESGGETHLIEVRWTDAAHAVLTWDGQEMAHVQVDARGRLLSADEVYAGSRIERVDG